jgi:hypothetical protein
MTSISPARMRRLSSLDATKRLALEPAGQNRDSWRPRLAHHGRCCPARAQLRPSGGMQRVSQASHKAIEGVSRSGIMLNSILLDIGEEGMARVYTAVLSV